MSFAGLYIILKIDVKGLTAIVEAYRQRTFDEDIKILNDEKIDKEGENEDEVPL